ncbi:MAG: endopeptidase La [Elusimicrobia bacterium]|nr:endopeptidase La [Elusimicrobiota bacterium]
MIPAPPSARAIRIALAASVLLQSSFAWSQRVIETPVVPLSASAAAAAGAISPAAPQLQLGPVRPAAAATVSAIALQAGPASKSRLALSANAQTRAGALATAGGRAGALSAGRTAEPAGTGRELASSLSSLSVGAETRTRAISADGVSGGMQASTRFFEAGRSIKHHVSGTGSTDGSSSGGNAGGSGGASQNGSPNGLLPKRMPVIVMREPLFPGTQTNFYPGNQATVELVAGAASGENGGYLLVATSREENPSQHFPVASVVRVVDFRETANGAMAVFEVVSEAVIDRVDRDAKGRPEAQVHYQGRAKSDPQETRAMIKTVKDYLREVGRLDTGANPRLIAAVLSVDDGDNIATVLGSEMPFPLALKQNILAARSTADRLRLIARGLVDLKTEGQLTERAKAEMGKQQKEYMLRQRMKAIQQELGEDEDGANELEEFAQKVEASGMPDKVKDKARGELKKLRATNPQSSEYTVGRNYVEWLVSLPWGVRTEDRVDLKVAQEILDRDHDGLKEVKDRVLEFLSVRKQTGSKKGAILVFDGPPGTGKTSIGRAIAEAMNRNYIRFSVGGVSNESEIRGHRRTYVGAMPGTPIQKLKEAGSVNAVFVVDEGDKIGQANPTGGDPSAALLELFDPEQNFSFRDHYLDVPFDFSEVIFVVTSNELMKLPEPLRHRMELIQFSAYTDREKLSIVQKHILDKIRGVKGLTAKDVDFTPEAILRMIRGWTHEAGVREIERKVDEVLRKIVTRKQIQGEPFPGLVEASDLERYLGRPEFSERRAAKNGVGTGTGLSVSGYGGDILSVEATATPGTGKFTLRQQMLDMTNDSALNVLTYVKSVAARYGVQPRWFREHDIDIAFAPAGKIQGPSAGIVMATALMSEATGRAIKDGVAMTGELTTKGWVKAIGGLKEKVLAAHRLGFHTVVFPEENLKDIEKIPEEVRAEIKLIPVSRIEEVFDIALEAPAPAPGRWERLIAALRGAIGR